MSSTRHIIVQVVCKVSVDGVLGRHRVIDGVEKKTNYLPHC